MSSFIPISGIKKPQNNLEGPIYPDIKKDILRFKNSRKYWKVDIGDALKESGKYSMFVENIVEPQSRNRNVTMYGQSSHRDYVNEETRFPLISPYDLIAESKKPRRPVAARVNPGLAEYQIYQENMINEVYGYITDRVTYVPSYTTFVNQRPNV
jgi:hypothetical protein